MSDPARLTLGNDPRTFAGFIDHLETNCCRASYVSWYLRQLTENNDLHLPEPVGQDGTPTRVFRRWLALWGGRFVPTPFDTGNDDEKWTLAHGE